MLSVRYGNDVPPAVAEMVEHYGRMAGLSLAALEVVGASLDFAEAFIIASEGGNGASYARALGLLPPEDKVSRARWQADRLFG